MAAAIRVKSAGATMAAAAADRLVLQTALDRAAASPVRAWPINPEAVIHTAAVHRAARESHRAKVQVRAHLCPPVWTAAPAGARTESRAARTARGRRPL